MASALNGANLYTMTGQLLGGLQIDSTLFYQLLTIVQERIESSREWMILRKQDSSKTWITSDKFTTSKALPSDFFFWQTEQPIMLVDPTNTANFIHYLREIPFAKQYEYQFQTYRFATDYLNSLFYLMGTADRTYTIYQNYIYKPADVTATTSWVFPAHFHPLLAYDVAAMWKGGIDFDDQNREMASDNTKTRDMMYESMVDWDTRLQAGSVTGVDRGINDDRPWRSGAVDIYQ